MKLRTTKLISQAAVVTTVAIGALTVASPGWASSLPGQGFLPDNRAWEMVSPPDKAGGEVRADPTRSGTAEGAGAFWFSSLRAFGDASGTGVATDYIAVRSSNPAPGDNGWSTHAITPLQAGLPVRAVYAKIDPHYDGGFSPDLTTGVFEAWSPLTDNPFVQNVRNLYLRTDALTAGTGKYELITACPLCEQLGAPLAPPGSESLSELSNSTAPTLATGDLGNHFAAASPDDSLILFESYQRLTEEAPPQPSQCSADTPEDATSCRLRLYEWENGTVRLAGILPSGRGADVSISGRGGPYLAGTTTGYRRPHVVSNGADGHLRVFFIQPTNERGESSEMVALDEQHAVNERQAGKLFMRVDGVYTEQLNVSERTDCAVAAAGEAPKVPPACTGAPMPDAFAPATYLDASADGTRVFFMTKQALTDDAAANGSEKIYEYDASKSGEDPHNLTLLTPESDPHELKDEAVGMIGASDDGQYAYLLVAGQLISGKPLLFRKEIGIYLSHEGSLAYVGSVPDSGNQTDTFLSNADDASRQAYITPDGHHLLFASFSGAGLTGYPAGNCIGSACSELYLFDANTATLRCVSCNPNNAPPTTSASTTITGGMSGPNHPLEGTGAASQATHDNHPLSNDGRFAFFNTGESLVPGDTNGAPDAYEYDSATGELHLLSSGQDGQSSYFLDASTDGSNAFIVTRQALSEWDFDRAYDVYDARVGGGFPEPPAPAPACQGDACQPPAPALADIAPASLSFADPGNQPEVASATAKKSGKNLHAAKRRRRARKRRGAHGRRASHDRARGGK